LTWLLSDLIFFRPFAWLRSVLNFPWKLDRPKQWLHVIGGLVCCLLLLFFVIPAWMRFNLAKQARPFDPYMEVRIGLAVIFCKLVGLILFRMSFVNVSSMFEVWFGDFVPFLSIYSSVKEWFCVIFCAVRYGLGGILLQDIFSNILTTSS
jgi:hypothetical protein